MGCGPKSKNDRNWAIWREYHAGCTEKVIGERYDVSTSRVHQIRNRCSKELKWALERQLHGAGCPLSDNIQNGLIGVEFTFTMDDPWNVYTGRKGWAQLSDGSWFKFNIGATSDE